MGYEFCSPPYSGLRSDSVLSWSGGEKSSVPAEMPRKKKKEEAKRPLQEHCSADTLTVCHE